VSLKVLKYMQCGMKTDKQKRDAMLSLMIGIFGLLGLILGMAIGILL